MASFSAVNTTTLDVPSTSDRVTDVQTPTTPRPHFAHPTAKDKDSEANPTTPTRHDFAGVPGQRALPDQPLTPSRQSEDVASVSGSIKRSSSHRSAGSPKDVEMGEADDDEHDSDNDSVNSDSRPSKKKKGQRFFCTEFPPCQLSFTRSEHLARHIRKHTGERPFQCHCSRRFSRLDNLRQHAQTVHVNEDIPGDSLAATSTRFQRQIRTDRVRPPNGRARANTLGSSGTHSRGHSRNLSTSSIGSTTSSIASPEDIRRRPQPLAMANDPSARARLTLNTFDSGNNSSAPQYAYYNQSPSGYSTPTSTTFSAGPGSPHSAFASPSTTISRSSYYNGPRQGHSRRLSVPSGANPFNPAGTSYPPPFLSPLASGTSSTFSQSGTGFGSPTSSVYSHSRRDSETELEFRRRTWHPSTYSSYSQRPATSGLTYHQTVDDQRPSTSNQPAASQMTRLPGIESFDHAPPPSARPQLGEPMSDIRPASSAGLHHNLTRLDITSANASQEGQWHHHHHAPQPVYYAQPPPQGPPHYPHHQHSMSMPEGPVTPKKNKRQGWYGGPLSGGQPSFVNQRPSPEDSGSSDGVPTPSTSQVAEYHPVIVNPAGAETFAPGPALSEDQHKVYHASAQEHKPGPVRTDSGFHQSHAPPPPPHTYTLQAGHDPRFTAPYPPHTQNNDMGRLEALVAVATSESRAEGRQ